MVHSCCANNCCNRWEKDSQLLFHRFPMSNTVMQKKLVFATRHKGFHPTQNSFLCNKHFRVKITCILIQSVSNLVLCHLFLIFHPTFKNERYEKRRLNSMMKICIPFQLTKDIINYFMQGKTWTIFYRDVFE